MTPEERRKRVAGPSDQSFGEVVAIAPGRFLIRTDDGRQYWLSQDCVYTVDEARVTLICEREGLSRYVVEPPAGTPSA